MDKQQVVTAIVRSRSSVALLERPSDSPTYPGQHSFVSGKIEGDESPEAAAYREIEEEIGIPPSALETVREGSPLTVEAPEYETVFRVQPLLVETATRTVRTGPEVADISWVQPPAVLEYETVPRLFETYRRVGPTPRAIAADETHGAATLSIRALEVLRDRAAYICDQGEPDATEELSDLADRLCRARPSMAVIRNRVRRFAHDVSDDPDTALAEAIDAIEAAWDMEDGAVETVKESIADETVATLSWSSTMYNGLTAADAIFVAESRPAREGIDLAEGLADEVRTVVHTDAAIGHVLENEPIDAVVVGADTIRPDGAVLNKTGTYTTALAAKATDVPVYVAATTDKVTTRETVNVESGTADAIYDGDASVSVRNPTFDLTPAEYIEGYLTESGHIGPDKIEAIANEHRTALDPSDP